MNEVEITSIPPLRPGEMSMLDMHSVVNVLNVLRNELCVLGMMVANNENLLRVGTAICDSILASLDHQESALAAARSIQAAESAVLDEIEVKVPHLTAGQDRPEVAETVTNIKTVLAILHVRAREILARAGDPEAWIEFDCSIVHAEFTDVFAAIERNSKGRYRILFNAARQAPTDYYLDLKIEADGKRMLMPPVFKDVMRDLIANARKYTMPGGHITAALYEDPEAINFVVRDNGRGIPTDELEHVVEFGKRGSNVGDVRTMGGGFGLTKAFLVTKQFGGRMWIASGVGVGTRIRIWIPRPGATSK